MTPGVSKHPRRTDRIKIINGSNWVLEMVIGSLLLHLIFIHLYIDKAFLTFSKAIMGVYTSVVDVKNKHSLIVHEISLMAITLDVKYIYLRKSKYFRTVA